MTFIRYTDVGNKVTTLDVETYKMAKRLYDYACRVVTAYYKIELVHNDEVKHSFLWTGEAI